MERVMTGLWSTHAVELLPDPDPRHEPCAGNGAARRRRRAGPDLRSRGRVHRGRRYPEFATSALDPEITRAAAEGMTWLNATASRWAAEPDLPRLLALLDSRSARFEVGEKTS